MHHLAVLELSVVSTMPKPRPRIASSSACLYVTISGAGTTARRPAMLAINRRGHAVVIARRSRRRRLRHLANTSAEACHPGRERRRHLDRCLGSRWPVLHCSQYSCCLASLSPRAVSPSKLHQPRGERGWQQASAMSSCRLLSIRSFRPAHASPAVTTAAGAEAKRPDLLSLGSRSLACCTSAAACSIDQCRWRTGSRKERLENDFGMIEIHHGDSSCYSWFSYTPN